MIAKAVTPNTISPSMPPREKLKRTAWTMNEAEAAAIAFCHPLSECKARKKASPVQVTSEIAYELLSMPPKPSSLSWL